MVVRLVPFSPERSSLPGRPAGDRVSDAGAGGGFEALFLIRLAIDHHRRLGCVIGEGAHAPVG
jgi:hypothetical protein